MQFERSKLVFNPFWQMEYYQVEEKEEHAAASGSDIREYKGKSEVRKLVSCH